MSAIIEKLESGKNHQWVLKMSKQYFHEEAASIEIAWWGTCNHLMDLLGICEWNKISTSYILCDSIYKMFSRWWHHDDKENISGSGD